MAAIKATAIRLIMVALLIYAPAAADAYTNHTVGGGSGWFFNSPTSRPSILGTTSFFNTNTNQTVIQTYNKTTYESCITDDSLDTDTFQYGGGNDEFGNTTVVSVPLTIEGSQYYFSDAEDGEQCHNGMAFGIKVNHGTGLPSSLNQPPPPAYVPPPASPEEGQLPPVTVVAGPPNGGVKSSANFFGLVLGVLVLVSFLG
ncbi:hypothetical protein OROHE_004967 [Orobanche hederae]